MKRKVCCACDVSVVSSDSTLPLCEDCLFRTEDVSESEWFRSSYCCPHVVLETHGETMGKLLQRLMLPSPSPSPSKPSAVSASEALRQIEAEPGAPLLILTGAGTSVGCGVSPGYGPPYDENASVNEKYWKVFVEATRARAAAGLGQEGFYGQLCAYVAAQAVQRSVCVATSNIDGLCPSDLGSGKRGLLYELHGSVARSQCSALSTAKCKRSLHTSAAPHGTEDPKHYLGNCPSCSAPLRFNVSGFNDYSQDVIGTSIAQRQLRNWVTQHLSATNLFVLCIGCSDHVHSMIHESRAIAYTRALASGLGTKIICVNPDSDPAEAVGGDCVFVQCNAEELFLSTRC